MWRSALLLVVGLGSIAWAATRALTGSRAPLRRPARAVAIGDSLTAHGGYVRRLRENLGGQWNTIAEEGAGVWRIVQMIRGRLTGYDTAVVLAGVNSLGRSYNDVQASLIELYRPARNAGVEQIVAVTMTPWRGYRGWSEREDAVRRAITGWQRNGAGGFIDAVVDTSSLGDRNGRLLPAYDAGDGLHMNAAGQRVLGDMISRGFR